MKLGDVELQDFSEALAQGIARAEELKRQDMQKSEEALRDAREALRKQEAAVSAVQAASRVFGGRLLDELKDEGAMPKAVEFQALWRYLSRCDNVEKILAAIQRELDWCAGVVAGGGPDVAAFGKAVALHIEKYREELLAFAQGLLADGAELGPDAVPEFRGTFKSFSRADPGKLAGLLAEVRRAFEKYRRVVEDNGPFSLHPTVDVETDEKLAECVDAMREANAKPYLGILDDDFTDHVDAFWYGFCKLGLLCEDKAQVDIAPLLSYFDLCGERLGKAVRAAELGDFDVFTVLDGLREED